MAKAKPKRATEPAGGSRAQATTQERVNRQRQVLYLRATQRLSCQQIADVLGVSERTVRRDLKKVQKEDLSVEEVRTALRFVEREYHALLAAARKETDLRARAYAVRVATDGLNKILGLDHRHRRADDPKKGKVAKALEQMRQDLAAQVSGESDAEGDTGGE